MTDVRGTLTSLFPNVRITSGARDPNSRLGRANPRSYHNVGRAFDVAPIPGVTFDQYIGKLKGAGVNVVEARDEVTNPSAHATGPHWHFAYGDKPQMKRPDPITRRLMPNYLQMSMPQGGVDPLAPEQPLQQPMGAGMGMAQPQGLPQPEMQQPNYAGMSQPSMGRDPLAPKPKAFGKGGIGWAILGSLGDALSAYGGQKGVFAPAMQDMAARKAQEDQFREKLAMEHQYRMAELQAKAQEAPGWLQDAQTFARLPDEQKQMVTSYRDAMYPVIADIQQPDGSVTRQQINRSIPKAAPKVGAVEDGYRYIGGDPANPQSWSKM